MRQTHGRGLYGLACVLVIAMTPAHAADIGYGGRLVDATGAPLAGAVDLVVRFFGSETGADQLGEAKELGQVVLKDGVFQVTLPLDAPAQQEIFGDGSREVYIEVTAGRQSYPRQRFASVPFALRIPVDSQSLVYGTDSRLKVGEIGISQVTGLNAALQQASQNGITASSDVNAASLTTGAQGGVVLGPYGSQSGATGEIRFQERSGDGYVGFRAPDAIGPNQIWTLPATDGSGGQVLGTDGAGALSWVTLSSANILDGTITDADIASAAAISDSKLQTISTAGKVSGAAITSGTIAGSASFSGSGGVSTTGPVTSSGNVTVNATGAATTEIRFRDSDNSNYVGFKAPASITADKVWTLPAADGGAGHFLATDGAGVLTWVSPAGGGDMLKSENLSGLANVTTARTNLGLGALATASAVGSAEITDGTVSSLDIADGTIANDDISGTAQIATSKLSGAVTSISGHGLGALAVLSGVSSAEITNGTIIDADISGTAAIATSKLSGAVTSIAGHGLGALATASAVGSAEITDGTISSIDVADGTITDADIAGTAAISSTKISFASGSVSGNAINGGIITNFRSTGLTDSATATAVTISSNGNVGIATTSPAGLLDVGATSQFRISATGDVSKLKGIAYSWPSAQGGASTVLSNDGSGNLSWAAAGGASQWTTSSSNIYYSSGNIGIGTTTPAQALSILGQTGSPAASGATQTGALRIHASDNGVLDFGIRVGGSGAWIQSTDKVNLGTSYPLLLNPNAGNVGIGITSPSARLHVDGPIVSAQKSVASGATVDFATGNVQVLSAPGGSTITLNNMVDGGAYTVLITDTTSRTYTFTNCTNSRFTPANAATTASTHSMYTILKVTVASATYCYISWMTDL